MAVLVTESFEGQPNGTAMTVGNSAFTHIVTAGWTFSNLQVLASGGGSLSGRCAAAATVVTAAANYTATSTGFLSFYLYTESRPAANTAIANLTAAGTAHAELRITPDGALQTRNSGLTQIAISPNDVAPLAGWCRVNWSFNNTTGTQRLRVYSGAELHGTTATYDSGDVASTAAGTIDRVSVGLLNSTTATLFFDNVVMDNAAFAAPTGTPQATNVAPTANAGPDQAGIEPGATVTLSGSVADSDGTATGTWTQTAGSPTVALAGSGLTRTFTAPLTMSGTTLTFALTATDNLGATGADSMTVAVLQASELVNIGGTWVPARLTVV